MKEGRFELKYALPAEMADAIRKFAAPYVRPDRHGGPLPWLGDGVQGYRVSSIYFDDDHLSGYAGRLEEQRIRNRVRIRTYGNPGEAWPVMLECKRKLHKEVVKHRVDVCDTLAWETSDPDAPWAPFIPGLKPADRFAAERFAGIIAERGLKPTCSTHYLREVLCERESRLTIDHEVRGSAWPDLLHFQSKGDVCLIPEGWIVLELKFNGREPGWMRQLVRHFGLVAEPVSKFALAMAHGVLGGRERDLRRLIPPSVQRAGFGPGQRSLNPALAAR